MGMTGVKAGPVAGSVSDIHLPGSLWKALQSSLEGL